MQCCSDTSSMQSACQYRPSQYVLHSKLAMLTASFPSKLGKTSTLLQLHNLQHVHILYGLGCLLTGSLNS